MPGPWTGQRCISRHTFKGLLINRIRAHHRFPFWPFGIANLNRNWSTQCQAVPHATEQFDIVFLKFHPGSATGSKPATRKIPV